MLADKPRKSKLVPIGIVLMVVGKIGPRPIWNAAESMSDNGLKSILFLLTDAFRLAFFIGLTCLIIGLLRNRRWRKFVDSH